MLEVLTGAALASAAGLNAYVPLLVLGIADRFIDAVALPSGWSWLSNEWVLGILGVLLVIEVVADKIPAVDTVNDWLQTIVRPASGGIVFGAGSAAETAAIADPAEFFTSQAWVPIVSGIALALAVHLGKALLRFAANATTGGLAAPVLSTLEDVSALGIAVLAIIVPVLAVIALVVLVGCGVAIVRAALRRRRAQRSAEVVAAG